MTFHDKIILPEMRFTAAHGVLQSEHEVPQEFTVSLTVVCDLSAAGKSDDLNDTLDYRGLYEITASVMLGKHHDLLESLAADIAKGVLERFAVNEVCVRVRKEAADFGDVKIPTVVEICRKAGDF